MALPLGVRIKQTKTLHSQGVCNVVGLKLRHTYGLCVYLEKMRGTGDYILLRLAGRSNAERSGFKKSVL